MITREVATKVLETVDAGLTAGMGKPTPGEMCVEAAICYALGLPHSDDSGCVSAALRTLSINLSEAPWSSPEARAKGLRRLALAQLGSLGHLDDREFGRRVAQLTIRKMVPIALRSAAEIQTDPKHRRLLRDAADRCEKEGTADAAYAAANVYSAYVALDGGVNIANVAYTSDGGATAALCAANAAADAAAAAFSAAIAGDAAADAANVASAAYTAAARIARDAAAAADAKRDEALSDFAEDVVGILIEMGAPGVQWLDLAA